MYRAGYYKTAIFKDSDGDAYNGISATGAEEKLEEFLNKLGNDSRGDHQNFQIVNISMAVDNDKTSILLVWKYV